MPENNDGFLEITESSPVPSMVFDECGFYFALTDSASKFILERVDSNVLISCKRFINAIVVIVLPYFRETRKQIDMAKPSSHEAAIANPALSPLKTLIGEWRTVGTHSFFPGVILHGHSSFNWIEGGAFLVWHSKIDKEEFPGGIAVFGSDDSIGEYFMLYFDERKVSRKYEVSLQDNIVKWWRNAPSFSQRYSWTFADNGNTIIGKGELCKDGKTWERDLDLTFSRVK